MPERGKPAFLLGTGPEGRQGVGLHNRMRKKRLPTRSGLWHRSGMTKRTTKAAAATLGRVGDWRSVKRVVQLLLGWVVVGGAVACLAGNFDRFATDISSLIDPAKLATLDARGANPRVEKYVALLAEAKTDGVAPKKVAAKAVALVGMKGKAGRLTAEAMVRNLLIAERLGCLDPDGLREMHKGQAPTVHRGPYRGEKLSVDHIIPRVVVPELDNVIANLELMPLKLNEGKNSKIGARQVDLARKLHKAGLLSSEGLKAVERKGK
jgi:hypothetical protein